MKNDDLKSFIINYMDNDKTGTALLLSAPWGFGKSYFVQEILKPFLVHKNYGCIVVSLYGLNSTQEISKQIYLNLRSIHLFGKKKSEFFSTGKVFGQTILTSALTIAGLDFSKLTKRELNEVYESINLSGKLIVLEDLERSDIRIEELLGYVNNLTENDHVKVLLVANENELIEKKGSDEDFEYTDKAKTYIKFKEKTIGDTISIGDDQVDAISNILTEYNLKTYFSANDVLSKQGGVNLRTFKYACQKTSELLGYLNEAELSDKAHFKSFIDSVFYGVLRQSIYLCENYDQASKWTGGKFYKGNNAISPVHFSSSTYQVTLLFKFCFDYLLFHEIPTENTIRETYSAYNQYCLYEANQTADDQDLMILKSYHTQTEKEVKHAVACLESKLSDVNNIPFKEYGTLARVLINIKYDLGINIDGCKKYLINNLEGKKQDIDTDALFVFDIGETGSKRHTEYMELKNAMLLSLEKYDDELPFGFDYDPKNLDELYEEAANRNPQEVFLGRFDIDKLTHMIKSSNQLEIDDFRGVLFAAYRSGVYGNRNNYYPIKPEDLSAMQMILDFISHENFDDFDKVQLLQLSMLEDNLKEMMNSANNNQNYIEEYLETRAELLKK